MKGWRYQPVVRADDTRDDPSFVVTLVEVYIDDDDRLENWTENLSVAPQGDDVEGLTGDLAHMMMDAMCWKPVSASSLKVGMTFERSVSQSARNDLAEMIERTGSLLRAHAN